MTFNYASVASGSCGNCHYVGSDGGSILIDAGLSGKRIENNLQSIGKDIKDVMAIFITHEHVDHIKGAGILSRRYDIPIYANEKTWISMKDKMGKMSENNVRLFENEKGVGIGDFRVKPFKIHHDAADPVGYSICSGDKKISIATDTGHICQDMKKELHGSSLVVLESNHDVEMLKMGSYPYHLKRRILSQSGHLSNDDAAMFCVELAKEGVENILLAHLSRENNFPELAYQTAIGTLKMNGLDESVNIRVLKRQEASPVHSI
ncbi:Phosphoribosyl 1,2-cyclic phosphodiesterase [Peptoclostridium litorale DSM 5388]|uniref:Metallo-beta-lactamase superfamily protein n=1 Tax=Peptoclostridium litorale DSM 5388 TaxID=1121324 RepID=A0A069RJL6_PEPLI|nr:MBL fold metallo-hydrolase [Peptoclostridium litorale]KDR96340.1 metallo-beta-lactamase superfamily protein [Peptoclostridium litorale DSM 5388]SIO26643.1 Phosphoribosyl 1,2-cyclic phosphodiesterase [Peptoclostridium litorale DSM 5388]